MPRNRMRASVVGRGRVVGLAVVIALVASVTGAETADEQYAKVAKLVSKTKEMSGQLGALKTTCDETTAEIQRFRSVKDVKALPGATKGALAAIQATEEKFRSTRKTVEDVIGGFDGLGVINTSTQVQGSIERTVVQLTAHAEYLDRLAEKNVSGLQGIADITQAFRDSVAKKQEDARALVETSRAQAQSNDINVQLQGLRGALSAVALHLEALEEFQQVLRALVQVVAQTNADVLGFSGQLKDLFGEFPDVSGVLEGVQGSGTELMTAASELLSSYVDGLDGIDFGDLGFDLKISNDIIKVFAQPIENDCRSCKDGVDNDGGGADFADPKCGYVKKMFDAGIWHTCP